MSGLNKREGDMETEEILKERLSRLYEHYDKLYLESQSVMEYIQDLEDELDNLRGEE